jgi:hypothetical protein
MCAPILRVSQESSDAGCRIGDQYTVINGVVEHLPHRGDGVGYGTFAEVLHDPRGDDVLNVLPGHDIEQLLSNERKYIAPEETLIVAGCGAPTVDASIGS